MKIRELPIRNVKGFRSGGRDHIRIGFPYRERRRTETSRTTTFTIFPSEREQLKERAKRKGMTISAFIRHVLGFEDRSTLHHWGHPSDKSFFDVQGEK